MIEDDYSPGPTCCVGECCGPGSYCCSHPDNKHDHPDETMDFEDGKYTLVLSEDGHVTALRYGQPWREFIGDKFIGNVVEKLFQLERRA